MTDPLSRGPVVPPQPAVFLDRDGTLVEDPGYQNDPGGVELLPGAAQAVARLNKAGWLVVVVTNQSGIARGLIAPEDYAAVERSLADKLEAEGARIDRSYHCPHHPDVDGPCDCRKPGTLLYRRAAEELGIDLTASWGVGDRLSDLEPVQNLGGRAVLVRTGEGRTHAPSAREAGFPVVDNLGSAVALILSKGSGATAP